MYKIADAETENHESFKRFANPFDDRNYVVAWGWKNQGDKQCSWRYFDNVGKNHLHIEESCTLIVGHNLKFDLLYEWENPELKAFFKRGGRIWDTQYVEYLLGGMHQEVQMVSMDDIIEKYGGRVKLDEVKALWNAGYLTSEIDKDLLIDYLVGTEDEKRNSGDIGNTELIFLGQVKEVAKRGMSKMVMARMDGLCATTDMEYNGLKIDMQEAKRRRDELAAELQETVEQLEDFLPEFPDEFEFNWGSKHHVSALIFGGTLKYQVQDTYIDEKTGELARKKAKERWPIVNGVPTHPDEAEEPDLYLSGKRKGEIKTKMVDVPGELKTKYQDRFIELDGHAAPQAKWATTLTDAKGKPIYQTGSEIIEELAKENIPFLKLMQKRQDISKDLGTYYIMKSKGKLKGMLTCVMPENHIVHHSLNHTSTVTSRLSSNNPNMQNIPKEGTSEVKKMFISRWYDDGVMVEADYSQLEVVVQGMLTGDKTLISDLNNGVDFHCKRVSAWKGISYEEAVARCKDEDHPDYKTWSAHRTKAKIFSFQRAYGAGAALIAESTGMDINDVKALIEAEDILYPGILDFNDMIEKEVKRSAIPFRDPIRGWKTFRRGSWQSPTGTIYSWRSYEAPDYLQKRDIMDSFKPTELKNYPVQGTGGEIVQIICGLLWRHFLANDNYGGMAVLCNTVHDSAWIDSHKDVLHEMAADVKRIMESVPEVLNELYGMEVPVSFPVDLEAGANLYTKHQLKL